MNAVPETLEERRAAVLAGLDLATARGLEVGALHSPIVPRDRSRVSYVDWADTVTLRKKYEHDPAVDVASIVDVDYLWAGQAGLAGIVGDDKFDFAVASHVVEHVPDLVTWLAELSSVLAPGGEIRLVVPDRRFTFDYRRAETRSSEVLEAWIEQRRVPSARATLDMLLNYATVDHAAVWRGERPAPPRGPVDNPAHWLMVARQCEAQTAYHDVHAWVFTPRSFAVLMSELIEFDVLRLGCSLFRDTQEGQLDFLVGLKPCTDRDEAMRGWLAMAERAADAPWTRREHDAAAAVAVRLRSELDQARQDVGLLRASTCWRMTSPLRWLRAWAG